MITSEAELDVAPKFDQVAARQSSLRDYSFFFQNKKFKGFSLFLKEIRNRNFPDKASLKF